VSWTVPVLQDRGDVHNGNPFASRLSGKTVQREVLGSFWDHFRDILGYRAFPNSSGEN